MKPLRFTCLLVAALSSGCEDEPSDLEYDICSYFEESTWGLCRRQSDLYPDLEITVESNLCLGGGNSPDEAVVKKWGPGYSWSSVEWSSDGSVYIIPISYVGVDVSVEFPEGETELVEAVAIWESFPNSYGLPTGLRIHHRRWEKSPSTGKLVQTVEYQDALPEGSETDCLKYMHGALQNVASQFPYTPE